MTDFVRTDEANFDQLADFTYAPNYHVWQDLRMHYVDEGPRDAPVMLLLHGMPTWSYLYRDMIPGLVGEMAIRQFPSGHSNLTYLVTFGSRELVLRRPPFGTKANGFEGTDTEFVFNSPLHVKHVQQLADWQSDKTFVYGGRRNKGNALFSAEEVAMYTESSAGYAGFKKSCKFPFRTSMLPYWSDAAGAPPTPFPGPTAPRTRRCVRGPA